MRPLMIAAALAMLAAVPAQAQTADSHKPAAPKAAACRDADGKAAPCGPKAAKRTRKTGTAMPMITRCRDITSHQLTKCGGPSAEPVPAN
ncbi:MAG: hypothetical protein ACXU82_01285 [Caulobacteraceae bacterium]